MPRCTCVTDVLRDVRLSDGPDKMLGYAWVLCNILAYSRGLGVARTLFASWYRNWNEF